MPSAARPRGPLPARVYWMRRTVVLGLPLLLIVVITRFLGGSGDGKDAEQATRASAETASSASAEVLGPTVPSTVKLGKKNKGKKNKPPEPVLAEPTGPCLNEDIVVTPAVTTVAGGSDAAITLNVRTRETPACTWTVSADSITATITSGKDHIWSTRECPAAIAPQDIVVRHEVDAPVVLTWSTRRSEPECGSPSADWAKLGWYHIEAAAWAGEPTDVQFEVVAPSAPVVTKTADPKPQKGKKGKKRGPETSHKAGEDGEGNSEG